MKRIGKKYLSRYVAAALTVGLFGFAPVAYALPVAITDGSYTNTTGTNIATETNQMNITGKAANNVMNWQSFSIAKNETVTFDEKSYLNLVRGASKSEIDGVMSGGGNIYLINPNGILFGATAQVNVGNLVASTRAITEADQTTFLAGNNPITINTVKSAAGDIVNLGKLQAASVVLEGNNITIQNAADITSGGKTALTDSVTAKAAGIITVGHAVTATTTRSFTINGTATDKTVHDYANATVASSGYKATALDGTTSNAIKESMLVDNVYDLQNMDTKLSGNYMLSSNIDASETSNWNSGAGFSPVGNFTNAFTGNFDGVDHTISGLHIYRPAEDNVGLFGTSGSGTIQNVGMVGGSITGQNNVGGVVGYQNGGVITNVYNTSAVSSTADYVGGIIGYSNGSQLTNVYNTGAVSGSNGYVGGVIGYFEAGGRLTNAYSTGVITGTSIIGGITGYNAGTVTSVYNTGAISGTSDVGGVVGINGGIGTVQEAYNTGAVSGSDTVGGVAGLENAYDILDVYNTGAVSGTSNVGGVAGRCDAGSATNAWYATTNATGSPINQFIGGLGTGVMLTELQTKDLATCFFPTFYWRTNATDGSTAILATTPMLQAFKATELDDQIAHTAVQYGTAEAPLTNIYQTDADLTVDMSALTKAANVGAVVYGHNLTLKNVNPGDSDTSTWGSYAQNSTKLGGTLTLQNDNGFTINSGMTLLGTNSIILSAKDNATGTIIDYGKNATAALTITAKDIVLDTDRVDLVKGYGYVKVALNATGTAKAGYTPSGTAAAIVNGDAVNEVDYAKAAKRTYYPQLTVSGGATLSEGQWIKNVAQLQSIACWTDALNKTYFLYDDIDASETAGWNSREGFYPIGTSDTPFTGIFDGLSHTIDGLYIDRPTTDYMGLFGVNKGTIQNVGMVGGSIIGHNYVGSVVGKNDGGTVADSYNTGSVSGKNLYAGGLVGSNSSGIITNSYNTGTVSGESDDTGGVVGINYATITNVYNTGAVKGTSSSSGDIGGVVGSNCNNAHVLNAYNTGTVTSPGSDVGGVAGYNNATITNVYNTGEVSGKSSVGGVVGTNYNSHVSNALWAKDLTYTTTTGVNPTQAVSNVADTDTVKGVALADMKKAATYSNWSNDGDDTIDSTVASAGNKGTAWRIYEGNTTPLLTSFFKGVVTVTGLDSKTTTYNGTSQTVDLNGAIYSLADIDTSHILAGERNSGTYSAIYSDQQGYDLINDNTLTIMPKTLTATLMGSNTVAKVYDGSTAVTAALTQGTNYQFTGIVDGDTLGLTGTGTYKDKNAADGKYVSFTGLNLTGTDAGNYTLMTTELSGNVGQITQKDLTVALLDGQNVTKVYDGTTTVTTALVKDQNYSLPDLVSGDAVTLTASGTYDNKNAGTGKQVSFTSLGLTGTDAGNYNLKTKELGGAIGQIDQKSIAAEIKSGSTFAKEYDGTDVVTTALVKDTNYVLPKMVSGDDLSLDTAKISGTYTVKDVGNDLSVIFTGLKLTGKDAGNYDLLDFAMGENYGKITPKALTATLTGDNVFTKVYDGTTTVIQALGTNYTLDGIVADSDKVSLSAGSGAYNDKNAGDNKTITFSGLTLTGTGAGNYTIASTLSGAIGQITRKTITGALASGYSFDKTYDGTTTAQLGNGYTLSGVVAGDTVPLTAANGFYDSSAIGDRTVTFSGFSINDGNYLLSMADSLSGIGKITSGSQDHNYSDALAGVSSFFGTNPSGGYTIFSGAPEDYIARSVSGQTRYSTGTAQAAQAGTTEGTLHWYSGPLTLTIVNGGITLPKDILLGSTYDNRTVIVSTNGTTQQ